MAHDQWDETIHTEAVQSLRPQSAAALRAIEFAGLALIRETATSSAVTVRALARRTHYSASTVGYHIHPIESFFDRLWRLVGADLATFSFYIDDEPGRHDSPECSERLLAWMQSNEPLARFFVAHAPRPPAADAIDCWRPALQLPPPQHCTISVCAGVHLMERRLQALIGYTAAQDGLREQLRVLDAELTAMRRWWRREGPLASPTHPSERSLTRNEFSDSA